MQETLTFRDDDDEGSCLFIYKYKVVRAHCPFYVICVKPVNGMEAGERVEVVEVLKGSPNTLVYCINDRYYPHHYFEYKPPTNLVITRLKRS
ncbi:hypothetical protein [Rufibacter latericius]|nr:hypothetical protein [Rufibacter latericius]